MSELSCFVKSGAAMWFQSTFSIDLPFQRSITRRDIEYKLPKESRAQILQVIITMIAIIILQKWLEAGLSTPGEDKDKVAKYIWFGRQMIVSVLIIGGSSFSFLFGKVGQWSGLVGI